MVLVTGGTGLVGIHLLVRLSKATTHPIIAIYRTQESVAKASTFFLKHAEHSHWESIKWVKADVTDIPSLQQVFESGTITQVYHCAAMVSFRRSDFKTLKKVNIEGTANMVNLSVDCKVAKFCYVSSIATLNLKTGQTIIDETSSWNSELDNSGYAISKFGGEMEVRRGIEEGLSAIIVHPGVIIGEVFRKEGSSAIFENLKNGMPFYTSGSSGYVTAFDVGKAMVELMRSNQKNENFVLVSENLAHKKVTEVITKSYGKNPPTIKISNFLLLIMARVENIFDYLFNYHPKIALDMVHSLCATTNYSSEKIKSSLGFEFESVIPVLKKVAEDYNN